MKGTYVLIIENKKNQEIKIGKLGTIFFKKGFYAYVGSAQNGLKQRINRHIRSDKKYHWHIDYLLKNTKIVNIYYKEGEKKDECIFSNILDKFFVFIPRFGCSDCKCNSHLYYSNESNFNKYLIKNNMCIYKHIQN